MKLRLYIILYSILLILAFGCASTGRNKAANPVLRTLPREERVAMMVLNFKNGSIKASAAEFQPWEHGLASMVMTDLESIGVFNNMGRERLDDILAQQAFQLTGAVDEKTAVNVGKLASAKYLLSGSFMVINNELHIDAKVFSIEKGIQLGAASVNGKFDDFFQLEKRLVVEMTSYLGVLLNSEEKIWFTAQVETKSVDASLQNYAGEIALVKAREYKGTGRTDMADKMIQEARTRFEKALKYDPSYERAKKNLSDLTMAMPMTL
jgi:TolB-like protein